MDALDLRILHTMGYTPWGHRPNSAGKLSPSVIAEEHDVSPETVARRIDRMEDEGVITHYEAYPNPSHLDLQVGGYGAWLEPGQPDAETLARVQRVDGVVETIEFRDAVMAVGLAYRDDKERRRRLALLADLLDDELVRLFEPPTPAVDRELDAVDWQIVRGLRGQADRSLSELADELPASYRTVKRRRDRMVEEGSLTIVPWVQTAAVRGLIHFVLATTPDDATPTTLANRLSERFGERVQYELAAPNAEVPYAAVALFASTLAEVEEMREEAGRLPGVGWALTFLPKRRSETDWLDEQIDRQARATARS